MESSSSVRNNSYHDAQYWDKRYKVISGLFDWYTDYCSLKPLLRLYLAPESKILNIGCGNSALAEDLAMSGYPIVTSIDASKVCIDVMRERYSKLEEKHFKHLEWLHMDATKLEFKDSTFDLAIEKGTVDALLCGENKPGVISLLLETWRVLKKDGYLILITHGQLSSLLTKQKDSKLGTLLWEVKVHRVPFSPSALLMRRIRAMLDGKPLSSVTKEMREEALIKTQEDLLTDFQKAEDLGPEKNLFCYAHCCRKL
mmetsp:Transcript_18063/g.27092  ORF Transcript_18063/g.27092 Transcript_18063/m.27092 type:complete len:256 (-) Transcript_18063:140-907(-)